MIGLIACFGLSGFSPQPRATPSPELSCAGALKSARVRLEKIPLERRIAPTLELIGTACRGLDVALANAAAQASSRPRAERAAILARGQSSCTVASPTAAAQSVAAACPPAASDPQGPILRALDAGTYAFVRALRARLEPGKGGDDAELVLSSLALAVAMEDN